MEIVLGTTLLGLMFGTLGTTLGGIIGVLLRTRSNKFLSFILEFAAGLMIAIVCFELIPESIELSGFLVCLVGLVIGVVVMMFCDNLVNYKYQYKLNKGMPINSMIKTGVIVGIGLAIHNFPEGLAIGSGFGHSEKLGLTLAIAILIHDIPEGVSMSVPMKNGGMKTNKVLLYTFLSGITTGIGAFFGVLLGVISEQLISICLGFAAGAMLYIVVGELIPESHKLYRGRWSYIGNLSGFLLGIISMQI